MCTIALVFCSCVAMVTAQSQIQGLKIPPGARVEFEVEFATPRGQQSQASPTAGSGMAGPMSPMAMAIGGMPGQSAMMTMAAGSGMPGQGSPMGMTRGGRGRHSQSVTQQLLTNLAQTSLRMRSMSNVPVPVMEEPCPCDADCCQRPTEPRRLVPVLHLPMTSHRGCCGCIDCPVSAYPQVGYMIMSAVMTDKANGTPTMGPA